LATTDLANTEVVAVPAQAAPTVVPVAESPAEPIAAAEAVSEAVAEAVAVVASVTPAATCTVKVRISAAGREIEVESSDGTTTVDGLAPQSFMLSGRCLPSLLRASLSV